MFGRLSGLKESDLPVVPQSGGEFPLDDRITRVLSEERFCSVREIEKNVTTLESMIDCDFSTASQDVEK
jgi:hypothetical protein